MDRYAIYYAPAPGDPLAAFGARWLGRDAATGQNVPQPVLPGLDLAPLTLSARLYGFHATLKAPFALAEGRTPATLTASLAEFALTAAPVAAPPLRPAVLDGFIALIPDAACPALDALAAEIVRRFDPFRAPLPEAERERRLASGLTSRQIALLDRWGYPFVMEQFRFHMTLTDRLDGALQDRVLAALAPEAARFRATPLPIDALALFHQPDRNSPFRIISRHALQGSARAA